MEESESGSCSVVSDSWQPGSLYSWWNSPGQNIGVGSCSLLQGIFQPRDWTQVSCIAGGFFTSWATKDAILKQNGSHTRSKMLKKHKNLKTTVQNFSKMLKTNKHTHTHKLCKSSMRKSLKYSWRSLK